MNSANILVGENFEIKVCDFGIAKAIDYEKTMSVVGTISYSAPVIFL